MGQLSLENLAKGPLLGRAQQVVLHNARIGLAAVARPHRHERPGEAIGHVWLFSDPSDQLGQRKVAVMDVDEPVAPRSTR